MNHSIALKHKQSGYARIASSRSSKQMEVAPQATSMPPCIYQRDLIQDQQNFVTESLSLMAFGNRLKSKSTVVAKKIKAPVTGQMLLMPSDFYDEYKNAIVHHCNVASRLQLLQQQQSYQIPSLLFMAACNITQVMSNRHNLSLGGLEQPFAPLLLEHFKYAFIGELSYGLKHSKHDGLYKAEHRKLSSHIGHILNRTGDDGFLLFNLEMIVSSTDNNIPEKHLHKLVNKINSSLKFFLAERLFSIGFCIKKDYQQEYRLEFLIFTKPSVHPNEFQHQLNMILNGIQYPIAQAEKIQQNLYISKYELLEHFNPTVYSSTENPMVYWGEISKQRMESLKFFYYQSKDIKPHFTYIYAEKISD